MLFSSLRKRYETTPLFLFLVRPRMLHCTPAAGTAEHQGLHNQIRCFSGCGSQASYCVGIRSNGTLLRPPAQAPIACTVPSTQTAFHFIQIKFKRCIAPRPPGLRSTKGSTIKYDAFPAVEAKHRIASESVPTGHCSVPRHRLPLPAPYRPLRRHFTSSR